MQKLTITIAMAVIALALGTTMIMTTMQIQPAYSQVSHCVDKEPPIPGTTCITPGQNPMQTDCTPGGIHCEDTAITNQEAGQAIGQQRSACAQGTATGCTIDQDGDGRP
jgi:hypothetical protein